MTPLPLGLLPEPDDLGLPDNLGLAATNPLAPAVMLGDCRVLAGASSWADRSLVRDGTFYPSRSLNSAQKLGFYASRLPLAEVATTFRFPPTPELAQRWVEGTPAGFTFDVRAWSLLCGAPTWPESLWPDLWGHVRPSRREATKLYRHRLPEEIVDECWHRFNHAIAPLARSARLGAVIMRYPGWFSPGPAAWQELAQLPLRLPGLRVAVELSNHRWFDGDACETTLGFLEDLGLCFVCRDRPGPERPVVAATGHVGFARLAGRSQWWHNPSPPAADGDAPGPDEEAPWRYRYSDEELASWAPAIRDLASGTSEVHILMDNCWRADAVDNASTLLGMLA